MKSKRTSLSYPSNDSQQTKTDVTVGGIDADSGQQVGEAARLQKSDKHLFPGHLEVDYERDSEAAADCNRIDTELAEEWVPETPPHLEDSVSAVDEACWQAWTWSM